MVQTVPLPKPGGLREFVFGTLREFILARSVARSLQLQVEGFKRNVLRSDQEFAGEGRFGGAPVKRLFGGDEREIGIIVFLGDVRQHKVASARIKAVGIGQVFTDGVIGEVSGAGEDTLLDDPRIWADFQHIQIVIGFEDQAICFSQMDFDELGHVAEVGADGHLGAVRAECESDGVGSIVRNGEGVYVDIANCEALAGLNGFHASQALGESTGKDALQRVHGRRSNVKRHLPEPEDLRQAVAVVGVLVSDQDGVEVVKFPADGSEAGQGFAFAKAGVNKDAGAFSFEQRGIARTAGRKNGDAQTD